MRRSVLFRMDPRTEDGGVTLVLQGRLTAAVIPDARVLAESLPSGGAVDASQLFGIDDDGLALMRSWMDRGIRIEGLAPSMRLRLERWSSETRDERVQGRRGARG